MGDPPILGAPEATRDLAQRFVPVYATGRLELCRKGTERALIRNDFALSEWLVMRRKNDLRDDHVVKAEMINDVIGTYNTKINIVAAIDDDRTGKLRAMYLSRRIPHFYSFAEWYSAGQPVF